MRRRIINLFVAALMIFVCQQVGGAQKNSNSGQSKNLDRVIAFVVQLEIHANRLENRTDVCVGFGNGLIVDEKAIIAELKQERLRVHSIDWCNQRVLGLTVSLIPAIKEPEPGTYEVIIVLGDLRPIRDLGEDLGTLLRRGTYTVKYKDGAEPELVRYQETAFPPLNPCGCI
ncbi:MAG TPA: hypothetical protein VN881_14290 [Candidatus Acidoferrales bacterium]|nr:hypothetical protein [Candidatus Acidoferrales bacterium]